MADQRAPASSAPAVSGRLRNDVLITYGGKVATIFALLLTSVVLARQLGPSGRGTLAVALSFAQILVQLGSLGIATANPYFVARQEAGVPDLVSVSLWFSGLVGVLLALVGAVTYALVPDVVGGIDWATLGIAGAIVPAMLAGFLLQALFLGEGRIVTYSAVEAGQALGMLVALVVGFALFDVSATKALAIMCAAYWVGAAVMLFMLRDHRPFPHRPDLELARRLLGYGVRIYAATILAFLVLRFDILLVNGYLGSANAGIYAVVASIVEGMYLLPAAIGLNVFRRIASGEGTAMTAEVFRTLAVLYALFCLVTIPFASPMINLLFGSEFSQAVTLYYWIVPGVYALGMVNVISSHLAGRGYPPAAILIWVVGLAVNIVMNIVLLPSHGLYIASLTSSVSYGILLILHMALLSRDVGGWRALIPRPRELVTFARTVTRGR